VSPVGTGKSRLGACLVSYELEGTLDKRILILAPSALLEQWRYEIVKCLPELTTDFLPLIVDRKTYLELESKVPVGENPWPVPSVILMSVDLAKRDDMASNLDRATWDLIIFDESHLFSKGKRAALLERLRKTSASRRGLLLSGIPHHFDGVMTKVVYEEVLGWDGRSLFPHFERKLTFVDYYRTEEEKCFLGQVQDFATQLASNFPYGNLLETNILRAGSSSVYALECILRRLLEGWRPLRNKITHNVPWTDEDLLSIQKEILMGSEELGIVEEMTESLTARSDEFLELYMSLKAIIDQIDEISVDSKLETVLSYASSLFKEEHRSHVCIWCSFVNTAEYITSSLQDLGWSPRSITGALKVVERMETLEIFKAEGGMLITTEVLSEGAALEYVDECINYDLPFSARAFEQRWGRFLRIGRKEEFRMVVLRDLSEALSWEEKVLQSIK
jgi:superfamily II DNA or RNA helicase